MSKLFYILTVLYVAYVVDEVEGDKIVAVMQETFHRDLSTLHQRYRSIRDNILNTISFSGRSASMG